mgnify:CR=1 FL=1
MAIKRSASDGDLYFISGELAVIASEIVEFTAELNDHVQECDSCGLKVKDNFKQSVWKKILLTTAKKLEHVSKEMSYPESS